VNTFKYYISELFDRPLPYKKISNLKYPDGGMFIQYEFAIEIDGITKKVRTSFSDNDGSGEVIVDFDVDDEFLITGLAGAAAIKIFTTVTAQIKDFINSEQPDKISFTAIKTTGEGPSRAKLYNRMTKRMTPKGYVLDIRQAHPEYSEYTYTKVQK
tara:strand:- start:3705 stop:4172 length:468 start_codon:yes stop_codon:yes gene_type:complete